MRLRIIYKVLFSFCLSACVPRGVCTINFTLEDGIWYTLMAKSEVYEFVFILIFFVGCVLPRDFIPSFKFVFCVFSIFFVLFYCTGKVQSTSYTAHCFFFGAFVANCEKIKNEITPPTIRDIETTPQELCGHYVFNFGREET